MGAQNFNQFGLKKNSYWKQHDQELDEASGWIEATSVKNHFKTECQMYFLMLVLLVHEYSIEISMQKWPEKDIFKILILRKFINFKGMHQVEQSEKD